MRRTASMPGESPTSCDGPSRRSSRCFERAILVGQRPFFGDAAEDRAEIGQLAGLGEIIEGPVAECRNGRLQRRLAGENHRFGVRGKFLAPGDDFQPVGAGHVEIDEDAIVDVAIQRGQRRRAVGADGHFVAHPRQLQPHDFLQRALVVGEEKLQFRGSGVCRCAPMFCIFQCGHMFRCFPHAALASSIDRRAAVSGKRTTKAWLPAPAPGCGPRSCRRGRRRCDSRWKAPGRFPALRGGG